MALGALWLTTPLARAADTANPSPRSAASTIPDDAERFRSELAESRQASAADIERDRSLARWKFGLVVLALGAWGALRLRRGGSPRSRLLLRAGFALVALASIASYFRFSWDDRNAYDMQIKDVYHYYIGAKYFDEVGYGGIYDCTLAAAAERRMWWLGQLDLVRDLSTMTPEPAAAAIERGVAECRGRFSDERWQRFTDDLDFFFGQLNGPQWRWMLLDHGYNPSPIWTLIASPLAHVTTAQSLRWLVQIDAVLVVLAFGAVGWAFGFDAMCLAATVWGTGFLWRHTWVGDAFLRQLWFASALIGVCLLRRGRSFAAGVLLAVAAGVRLFPAIFTLGYLIGALRERVGLRDGGFWGRGFWDRGFWDRGLGRFAAGAGAATAIGIAASLALSARGIDDYVQFADNTAEYRQIVARNMIGLEPLLWRIDGTTDIQWSTDFTRPHDSFRIRKTTSSALRWLTVGLFGWLYWRATRGARPWESAAAAFALIPIVAAPAGYYLHLCLMAIPLAERRPLIAVWLLVGCLAWLANGIAWPELGVQFGIASAIAVGLCLAVLLTMMRPADAAPAACRPRRASASPQS